MPEQNNIKSRIFNGYVPWIIFVFVISVSVFLFNNISGQVKTNTNDITDIKVFMGKADTTFKNINETLTEIKADLKSK